MPADATLLSEVPLFATLEEAERAAPWPSRTGRRCRWHA